MDLKFPRDTAPACLECGRPCIRRVTSNSNSSGNAGRPYYTCLNSTHGRKFICWDDDRGISSTNPRCECGLTSREFSAGGEEFYGCPVGGCSWVIAVLDLWSDCSRIDEAFGAPIVFEFGAQNGQRKNSRKPPVEIEIGPDFQWRVTTDPGGSPLCSICRTALEKLRGSEDFVSADVSPELRSRTGCHLCTLFVNSIKRRGSGIKTQKLAQVCKYGFEPMDLGQCTLYLLWREPGEEHDMSQVCHMSDIGCLPSIVDNSLAAEVGSFQKSISLARKWIQSCETAHSSCQNDRVIKFIPSRVIDVGEKRIFHSLIKPVLRKGNDLPPGSSYLTLSHCWGGVEFMCLLKSNLSSMMEHIPFDNLPKTFQDAIIVTQTLGMRYIWIDSLCIIQDDIEDWRYEAALMSEVYKYGTCNISASGAANGNVGLLFDHNPILTKPVKALFSTSNQGTVFHDFWPEGLLSSIEAEPLLNRGWVVQERLLSRRNLHFSRNQVIWECRSISACETFPDKVPFKETPQFMKHRFSRVVYGGEKGPQSLTEVWSFLVSQYTQCKLTKATDKLIAFGGIARTFNEPLGRHYIGGIWLENLVYQLCWTGKGRAGKDYVAPSWSWASTEGPVNNVFLPVHPSLRVQELEILEAHVELVSRSNPFGEVRSGHLKVASRLTTAKIAFEDNTATFFNRKERRSILLLPDAAGVYQPTREKIDLSWSEGDISEAQRRPGSGHLYLVAVMEHVNAEREYLQGLAGKSQMDSRRAPRTRWLILCPVENQVSTFTRCGIITADDSSHEVFAQACRWYDQTPGHLPVHSNTSQTRARYVVTII